jgi:YidC/Oxa1 family membrane protein insertase
MTRTMEEMRPRMEETQQLQDPRRRSEEQAKLYKEMGVNPLGCFGSFPLQLLILTALYATFRVALGQSPEAVVSLAGRLYPWSHLRDAIPLSPYFLWLNLSKPDQIIIPLAVAISTYVYQKVSSLPPSDGSRAMQTNLVNIMMPLLFSWLALALPSALGLYYVI